MITTILSKVFPPKLGKIENSNAVLLSHALRNGLIKTYGPEPLESWAGTVKEWREGRWRPKK